MQLILSKENSYESYSKEKVQNALDDQFTYYRKVVCECGILLSE